MTHDEINFVEGLLKAPLKKLRKMANDKDKNFLRPRLIVKILENELLVDEDIDDSFRAVGDTLYFGHRDVCSNMLPQDSFREKYENKEIE